MHPTSCNANGGLRAPSAPSAQEHTIKYHMPSYCLGFDHINRNAPVLIRTPKLTRFEPAQYWGGGPPGNSVVLNPFFFLAWVGDCTDSCVSPGDTKNIIWGPKIKILTPIFLPPLFLVRLAHYVLVSRFLCISNPSKCVFGHLSTNSSLHLQTLPAHTTCSY